MKLARRGFLRFIPSAAITVRNAAEAAALDLTKIEISGLGSKSYGQSNQGEPQSDHSVALANAMKLPNLRRLIESHFYENNQFIARIDPDLAVLRSFSLNAKITFQRQRNVAVEMHLHANGGWGVWSNRLRKLIGVL